MPKLIVQHQGQEWTVELKQGSNVVGRQSTCDIPIKESQLSRQHCDIVLAGTTCIAVDKGGMNGTLVNGKRVVQQQPLQPGDKVVVGPVVLWYERKNQGAEAPAPSTARAVARDVVAAPTNAATRRAVAADAPPAPAWKGPGTAPPPCSATTRCARAPGPRREDRRGGGRRGRARRAGLAGQGLLDRPSTVKEDQGGLVRDGGFEAAEGKPAGWTLPEKPASALSIDPKQGQGAGGCLAVEKAAAASDRLLTCAYAQDFPLGKNGAVEAEAQVRFETFQGWAALKIDWLREPRGRWSRRSSPTRPRRPEWTPLTASFLPPAGAGAFRWAGLPRARGGSSSTTSRCGRRPAAASGASTRWARTSAGAGRAADHPAAPGLLRPAGPAGDRQGRHRPPGVGDAGLAHAAGEHARLQGQAAEPHRLPGDRVRAEGLPRGRRDDDLLLLQGRVAAPDRPLLDRDDAPAGTGTPDPEAAVQPRSRMVFRTADGGFVLDYREPVLVASRGNVDGRHRIVQTFPMTPQQEEVVFGIRIREESAGGETDPQKGAVKAQKERRFGEAISLLRPGSWQASRKPT